MDHSDQQALLLPSDLVAEIEAVAAAEARPTKEVLRDAVDVYLKDHHAAGGSSATALTPAEAARRMIERRKHHPLPPGETIRGMIIDGRA